LYVMIISINISQNNGRRGVFYVYNYVCTIFQNIAQCLAL